MSQKKNKLGIVLHAFNPSAGKTEAGRLLDSLDYAGNSRSDSGTPCFKKKGRKAGKEERKKAPVVKYTSNIKRLPATRKAIVFTECSESQLGP